HYSLEQTNIDLNQLCRRADVRWINATATHIDHERKRIILAGQAAVDFDTLSIDIGATPDQSIKGSAEYAVGVKPIASFQQRWNTLLDEIERSPDTADRAWGIIGAGAGGVELVLAMAHRMRDHPSLRFHLIYRGARILPGYPARVAAMAERYLQDCGVVLHPNFSVAEVTAGGLIGADGEQLDLQQSIMCTGAVGAPWLAGSALACTDKNFIQVNRYLQSTSHADVFAVGDISEVVHDPRPKAGVFAVRQAPHLERNLRLYFAGQAMREVSLQKQFLSLLSMGDREAIASRNGVAVKGRWVWRWKDSIDQKFMHQFSELKMSMSMPTSDPHVMHCGGCGSKLGPAMLMDNLNRIANPEATDADKPGAVVAEDAFVWQPTPGTMALQSIDGFRSFTTDEYRFARICVNHAASDIQAMGANLTHVQAWINLAFSDAKLHQRDHLRILQGVVDSLKEQGASLSGGHSTEGLESHLAIVANGEVQPGSQWSKSGAQDGDMLVLNKRLGTGVILAADMQGQADADTVDGVYQSMLLSNQRAMHQLHAHQPHAVTDITGFGLIGHLLEMLDSSRADSDQNAHESRNILIVELDLTSIPILPGALDLAAEGWRSSLYPQLEPSLQRCYLEPHKSPELKTRVELLLDPQTSGGLLACLTESKAKVLLQKDTDFVAIGRIRSRPVSDFDGASIIFTAAT
ncbi:MAG: selenide, water dikinase SelD, partial [Arenicella sp.]|nr:selenide, water dikinase SelD [Arenicella sp.]